MSSPNDVIVFDEEYTYAANEIKSYCEALITMIENYSECVTKIVDESIQDDKISSKLTLIVNNVSSVKSLIAEVGNTASDLCIKYVSEIDVADKFLY